MSADNYAKCPACAAKHKAQIKAKKAELRELYGVVNHTEFQRRQAELTDLEKDAPPSSLREGWELGIIGNELFISYSAWCEECDFQRTFAHKEVVFVEAQP